MAGNISSSTVNAASADRKIYIFLAVWLLVNLLQAFFTELHPDEAYYWMYSQFLDWGYFDHPPMVALAVKAGDSLIHNPLGLRLATVCASTLSVLILWKIVRPYAIHAGLFILLFCSFVLFQVYGFITTPDAPMALFSILFFYLYQQYVARDTYWLAAALAFIIALLLYSKYHGILILFFTILSNLSLLKRPSFWLVVAVALLLYVPHIYWQVKAGLPSLHYHLFDRSAKPYRLSFTIEYLWAQLLVAGPLVGWYFYGCGTRALATDPLLKAVKANFYGIFLFFLLTTFKGRVEAHWTLIAFIPLFILTYIFLAQKPVVPLWLRRLLVINLTLIAFARIIPVISIPGINKIKAVKEFYGTEEWAAAIKARAGKAPVIFNAGFQAPSRYNYYNRTVKGFAYDSRDYRKTQYDIWPLEDSLRNKRIYYVLDHRHVNGLPQDSFITARGLYYGQWIDSVRLYQKVKIEPAAGNKNWNKAESREVSLTLYNPYHETIRLDNHGRRWPCFLEYGYANEGSWGKFITIDQAILKDIVIPANGTAALVVTIAAPQQSGKYKLLFSLRTEPFPGSANSSLIDVVVK